MTIQLIYDSLGQPIGVFMPIDEWDKLRKQYNGLDQYPPEPIYKQPVNERAKGTDSEKAYSVEQIRQTYPAAYAPWTTEDEHKLKLMYFEEKPVAEIAEVLGRGEGAILSRLSKLGINVIP